jgi:hypothetical protein
VLGECLKIKPRQTHDTKWQSRAGNQLENLINTSSRFNENAALIRYLRIKPPRTQHIRQCCPQNELKPFHNCT